jgi:hypothetical protein
VLNRALTAILDAAMGPLDRLPPLAGLAVLSLVTAVAVLLAFKWTADQRALVAAKRAMQAAIFEMRLFNDDLAALLRAQGDVLRHTLTYLRLSLAPTLWLVVPMLALMLHMEFHFGYTGLTVGEAVLVKVRLAAPAAPVRGSRAGNALRQATPPATLEAPDGLRIETPGVWLPSAGEVVWRIKPRAPGSYELRLHMGDAVVGKTLLVSDRVGRRSPVRPGTGFFNQLLNPSEPPLPAGAGLTAISIPYPERAYAVAGWDIGWAGTYLGLTLVFALMLKRAFGVVM